MNCPYHLADCPHQQALAENDSCPQCLRVIKRCDRCQGWNPAFANFCRFCRQALSGADGNWLGYRGSARRLGLNTAAPGAPASRSESLDVRETPLRMDLGRPCRSLLAYDRHVVAIAQDGSIEIGDAEQPESRYRFKAEGPVSCEPCIDQGVLYLGSRDLLTAYSLGALTIGGGRLTPLWHVRLSGTPIHALVVQDRRLYVTLFKPPRKQVQVFEIAGRTPGATGRVLHTSDVVSWLAGDPASRQVVFLSLDGRSVHLHTVTQPHDEYTQRPLSMESFAEQQPVALLGGKVFGVFGAEDRLCQIDVHASTFDRALGFDTKLFALGTDGHGWNGEAVRTDTTHVFFLPSDTREELPPLDRVSQGSPIIVRDRAAVLGMQDGQVRLYDLHHLPRYISWRVAADEQPITALASFGHYVAAGNGKGVVKTLELRRKSAAARSPASD